MTNVLDLSYLPYNAKGYLISASVGRAIKAFNFLKWESAPLHVSDKVKYTSALAIQSFLFDKAIVL